MNKKAVVILSGGLDSSTSLSIAKAAGYDVYALTFMYGQRHIKEVECAKKIASVVGVKEHRFISLPTPKGSALTQFDIEVPKGRTIEELSIETPPTYVPARNTLFIAYALQFAEEVGAEAVYTGITATDASVEEGSLVLTRDRGEVKIENVVAGDWIQSYDFKECKSKWNQVTRSEAHLVKKDNVFKVKIETGQEIVISGDHSLFKVLEDGTIAPAEGANLQKDDFIVCPSRILQHPNETDVINIVDFLPDDCKLFVHIPSFTQALVPALPSTPREKVQYQQGFFSYDIFKAKIYPYIDVKSLPVFITTSKQREGSLRIPLMFKLTPEFCFMLGLWVADGSYGSATNMFTGGGTIDFSCSEEYSRKKVQVVAEEFQTSIRHSKENAVDFIVESVVLKRLMWGMGFKGNCRTKVVPPFIYTLKLPLIAAFIDGYWNGDGSIVNGGIEASSVNKNLIQQLRSLLLKFGITSHGSKCLARHFYTGKLQNYYHYTLFITGARNHHLWHTFISPLDEEGFDLSLTKKIKGKMYGIPAYPLLQEELTLIKNDNTDIKVCKDRIRNNAIYYNKFRSGRFERHLLAELLPHVTTDIQSKWQSLLAEDIMFVRVIQVEKQLEVKDLIMYDLKVPGTENFIVNGILAHNSPYPDTRPEYVEAWQYLINLATDRTTHGGSIKLENPLLHLYKSETVEIGMELNTPYEFTWSCYSGGEEPCLECDTCKLRSKGFIEAGFKDPAVSEERWNNLLENWNGGK